MCSFSSRIRSAATAVTIAAGALTAAALPATAAAGPPVRFVPCNVVAGPNGLLAAITAANAAGSGTIKLAENCAYFLTAPDPVTTDDGLPLITGNVTLKGKNTVIRRFSVSNFRIAEVAGGGRLNAEGITFSGGSLAGDGGGLFVRSGGTLQLSDSRVSENASTANGGGGIFNSTSGTVRLFNAIVVNNRAATFGGGVTNIGGLTVVGGIVGFNTSGLEGGGVFSNNGTVSLTSTDLVHNTSNGGPGGGGLYNASPSSATVRNSRIQFNTAAGNGGGIRNTGPLQVFKTRISDNTTGVAAGQGGGLFNAAPGVATVRESTLTRNAASDGGAVFEAGGSVTAVKSLIVNNHPNNCAPLGSVPGCSG